MIRPRAVSTRAGRIVLRLGLLLAVGGAWGLGVLMLFEKQFIFFPTRYPEGRWALVPESGSSPDGVYQVWLDTEDGVRLCCWGCRPPPGHATPGAPRALLFFHGNAGDITDRYELIATLARRLDLQVLVVGYRGYGRSEGKPSEAGLYRDATAAWNYLTKARGLPPDRIVILGKSLGGAPAIELATRVTPAGLIIQSSFTSIADMAALAMPFVPRSVIRTCMDSKARVATLTCPKLFIHGRRDEVIPFRLGQALYRAAAEPKQWREFPDAGHNDLETVAGDAYYQALKRFVDAL